MQSAGALSLQGVCSPALDILEWFYKEHVDAPVIKKCQPRYTVALGSREQISVPLPRLWRALPSDVQPWFV